MASDKPSFNKGAFLQKSMDSTLHRVKSVLAAKKARSPDLDSSLTNLRFSHGLNNPKGENNCFLNSAVQFVDGNMLEALWHLDVFRKNFKELDGHACMGAACIFCALKVLFTQFVYSDKTSIPPDALRRALAISCMEQKRFQLNRMDDAAECFETTLNMIHTCLVHDVPQDACTAAHCIPHEKFSMNIIEQAECECGATSEPFFYSQYIYYITSTAMCFQNKALRCDKWIHPGTFGQVLQASTAEEKDCPSKCGKDCKVRKDLINDPDVVTVGLVWNTEPTVAHITDVMKSIGTSIKMKEMFFRVTDNRAAESSLQLAAFIAYYGKHYCAFSFHSGLKQWLYLEDTTVKPIGDHWHLVVDYCIKSHYQPLLLFYANPHWTLVKTDSAPSETMLLPGYDRNFNLTADILASPEEMPSESSPDADYWPENKVPEVKGSTSPCDYAAKTNPGGVIEIGRAALGLVDGPNDLHAEQTDSAAQLLSSSEYCENQRENFLTNNAQKPKERLNIQPLQEFTSLSSTAFLSDTDGLHSQTDSSLSHSKSTDYLINFSGPKSYITETEFSEAGAKTTTYSRSASEQSTFPRSTKLNIKPLEPYKSPCLTFKEPPPRPMSNLNFGCTHPVSNQGRDLETEPRSSSRDYHNNNVHTFSQNSQNSAQPASAEQPTTEPEFIVTYNVLSDYDHDTFTSQSSSNPSSSLHRSISENRGHYLTNSKAPELFDRTATDGANYDPISNSHISSQYSAPHNSKNYPIAYFGNSVASQNAKNIERSSAVDAKSSNGNTFYDPSSRLTRSDVGGLTNWQREMIGSSQIRPLRLTHDAKYLAQSEGKKLSFDLLPHKNVTRGYSPVDVADGNTSLVRQERLKTSSADKRFLSNGKLESPFGKNNVSKPSTYSTIQSVQSVASDSEISLLIRNSENVESLEILPTAEIDSPIASLHIGDPKKDAPSKSGDEKSLKFALKKVKELLIKSKEAEELGDLASASASCLQSVAILKGVLERDHLDTAFKDKVQSFYVSMRTRSRTMNKLLKEQQSAETSLTDLHRQQSQNSLGATTDESSILSSMSNSSSLDPLQSCVKDMKLALSQENHHCQEMLEPKSHKSGGQPSKEQSSLSDPSIQNGSSQSRETVSLPKKSLNPATEVKVKDLTQGVSGEVGSRRSRHFAVVGVTKVTNS